MLLMLPWRKLFGKKLQFATYIVTLGGDNGVHPYGWYSRQNIYNDLHFTSTYMDKRCWMLVKVSPFGLYAEDRDQMAGFVEDW